MRPVVVEVDALAEPLILLRTPAAATTETAASAAGLRGVCAKAAIVAGAKLRGVRLRGGEQVVVVVVAGGGAGDDRRYGASRTFASMA